MPTKRRKRLAAAIVPMTQSEWKFLMDEPCETDPWTSHLLGFNVALDNGRGELTKLWDAHSSLVLAEWVKTRPGTRPSTWWCLSAPRVVPGTFPGCSYDREFEEPRAFLGGAGCPDYHALNILPHFWLGVAASWLNFDPDNPPVFESQATYLKRHALFFPRERRELGAKAFEPAVLQYDENPLTEAYRENSEVQARISSYAARAVRT